MTDHVGQQLGNYRLIRSIGQGGFAEIYLGVHVRLGTQAAVKVLHTRLVGNDEVEHFQQEASIVAHLEHAHIVRVLDFDVQQGTPFLIVSYAPNGNLRQRHPRNVPLPLKTIVDYVKQVADALQYAHEHKVIHRDIKPENMLVGRHQEILLSDFGIALLAQSSRLQSIQEVAGTAQYMAPEQLQGKPRLASDQYALGIVVYEWLCGRRPFNGSFTEIASQHMLTPPPPLSEKIPTISPEVESVVLTTLEKDPHRRFASVQAFATALEQACQTASSHSVVLPRQITLPSEPSLLNGRDAVISLGQAPLPTNIVTPPDQSFQPTGATMLSHPSEVSPSTTEPVPSRGIQLPKRRISRRTLVLGLAGLGLSVTGVSIAWLAASHGLVSSTTSGPPATPAPQFTSQPSPVQTSTASLPKEPVNLNFAGGLTGWFLAGNNDSGYGIGVDSGAKLNGEASGLLRSIVAQPAGFGTLMQNFQGIEYRGKRVRMSGFVKAQGVEQWAGLWMRIDGNAGKMLSFDNMSNRPIQGTQDWAKYEIVLDVPVESLGIYFGILLSGQGQVWLNHVQFEVVGSNVPTTGS